MRDTTTSASRPSAADSSPGSLPAWVHRILWIDCSGALFVGFAMFLLAVWLVPLFALPRPLYFTIATANVTYGCCSLFLALRAQRTSAQVGALAIANAAWGCVSLIATTLVWSTASFFGLAHMIAEAAVVFSLGHFEWKYRKLLGR